MRKNIELANQLNVFRIAPESGAPILSNNSGAFAFWDVDAQCWAPGVPAVVVAQTSRLTADNFR